MSNPGLEPVEPAPTLIEQDGAVPETVIPPEPAPDEPVEETPEAPAAEAAPEVPEKPKRTPWYQTRIDEITAKRHAAERERDELKAKLSKSEGEEQPKTFDPAQFEDLIEQRAEAKLIQRQVQQRTQSVMSAGEKEFGKADFIEKCNEVAAMGAGDSREFMQIITDPEIIPDGHKVIAALAENPDEAERILALKDNPVRLAAALTKFATTAKAPVAPVSSAPKPITPVGGSARATAPADNDDIKAWMAKRNETAWDRRKA